MGVCGGQFACTGGAYTGSTLTILFNVVTSISFCTLVPVNHHNRQLV